MWAPGKDVVIRDGTLHCRLDLEHAYHFVEESDGFLRTRFHSEQPHLEFLKLENDKGLVRFVERWGPVALSANDRATGESKLPVSRYWVSHRYLTRMVLLLSAFHRGSGEAQALGGFLELRSNWLSFLEEAARAQSWKVQEDLEYLKWLDDFVNAVWGLPNKGDKIGVLTGEDGKIAKMLESASPVYVRRLLDLTISNCFEVTTVSDPMRQKRAGHEGTLIPRLKADELEKALECLILLDEWREHPLRQCDDCGHLFRSETRHPRRYCSPECARRVSSREYKRTIRAKQKRDLVERKR